MCLEEWAYVSDDLLVAEEVLEVGDLQVGGHDHDDDGDDAEDHHSTFDLLVLGLQALLTHDQHRQLLSQLLNLVLNLLGLELDGPEVLLGDNVGVVHGLDACLDQKVVPNVHPRVHILNADLVVAAVECCEVVTH